MAWNKSGIKDITINFDLTKLQKKLESDKNFLIPETVEKSSYKQIAEGAKKNIQRGNFNNNSIQESTKYIRNWRQNPISPPLIETGKLLNSIKPAKDGIEMEKYGEYHPQKGGYKIKSNKFTKVWNIKAGTRVKQRNFLDNIDLSFTNQQTKEIKQKINKVIRIAKKPMRK